MDVQIRHVFSSVQRVGTYRLLSNQATFQRNATRKRSPIRISAVVPSKSIKEAEDSLLLTAIPSSEKSNSAPCPALYIGVDPDSAGAIGVIALSKGSNGVYRTTSLQVADAPCVTTLINKKNRRRLNPSKALEIVREIGKMAEGCPVYACLEAPGTTPSNGAFSSRQAGYTFGVWHGVLLSHQIPVEIVQSVKWKRQLHLFSKAKEGSLLLAKQLFPFAPEFFKRKKDHGRAEALLLAAWLIGFRRNSDEEQLSLNEALLNIDVNTAVAKITVNDS